MDSSLLGKVKIMIFNLSQPFITSFLISECLGALLHS